MYTGLGIRSSICDSPNTVPSVAAASAAPATHATGRQRRDGRWPSGISRPRKHAGNPIPTIQPVSPTSPRGVVAGQPVPAFSKYVALTADTEMMNGVTHRIHARAFLGWRPTTRVPTTP